jgi:hypothetical protein
MKIKTRAVVCMLLALACTNVVRADFSQGSTSSSNALVNNLSLTGGASLLVATAVSMTPISIVEMIANDLIESSGGCDQCVDKLPIANEIIILDSPADENL